MSRRGAAAGGRATQDGGEGDIDLTPMLDVVFIMLIFFIVTSSFIKEPGVDITKVEAVTTDPCERGTIIFAVDATGKIHYDKKEVPLDRVHRLATAAKKDAPKANFVIQVDEDAPTAVLSDLLATMKPLMDAPLCVSTEETG
ncbi:MAG: biopolymer transporter ExbD [Halioglobus sp.]|nr:biopolymer transporter ExbD [Halioglobus sp.]